MCHDVLDEVEGKKANQITEILQHPLIQKHYLAYLKSRIIRKKIKGLVYLKDSGFLPDRFTEEVFEILENGKAYVAHAAALAMVCSSKSALHFQALYNMAKRYTNTEYQVIEFFWEYWENDKAEKSEKIRCFEKLLASEDLSLGMKAMIVRVVSGLQEHLFSIYFLDLLKFLNQSEQVLDHKNFSVALIEALKKAQYIDAEQEICDILKNVPGLEVEIACVQALCSFKTEKALQVVQEKFITAEEEVKKEISYLAERDPELSNKILRENSSSKIKLTGA